MPADRIQRWRTGIGLTGAVVAAAVIGIGTAHADPTDVADLLNAATANLTEGVDGLVNELFNQPTDNDIAQAVASQDAVFHEIAQLQSAETVISAHDGSLSGLVDELFSSVNQQWVTASEAVLTADQAFDAAVAANSGVEAAQLGLAAADFQLLTPTFESLDVVLASVFFGGGLTP